MTPCALVSRVTVAGGVAVAGHLLTTRSSLCARRFRGWGRTGPAHTWTGGHGRRSCELADGRGGRRPGLGLHLNSDVT